MKIQRFVFVMFNVLTYEIIDVFTDEEECAEYCELHFKDSPVQWMAINLSYYIENSMLGKKLAKDRKVELGYDD